MSPEQKKRCKKFIQDLADMITQFIDDTPDDEEKPDESSDKPQKDRKNLIKLN